MAHPKRPVFARLHALTGHGPIVTAHRGDSTNHPENTLPAFEAAVAMGAPMQEFDVQVAACGGLVCMHDATLDRTTDAARVLGPGALLSQLPASRIAELDAGQWKGSQHAGARVPTLAQALEVMLPDSVPMIEHKGGHAEAFVAELRRLGVIDQVLLQSFDWQFVAAARQLCPELSLGLLGPTHQVRQIDDQVLRAASAMDVDLVHWYARSLRAAEVERVHADGRLVCTYTSDDELAWFGAKALQVDAMCTNDPSRMLQQLGRKAAANPGSAAPKATSSSSTRPER